MKTQRHHGDALNDRIIGLVNVTYIFTSFTEAEIYEDRKIPLSINFVFISIVRRLKRRNDRKKVYSRRKVSIKLCNFESLIHRKLQA